MVTNVGSYDIFDALYPEYKTTKPIRLIEFFGGIGSQAKALERLGVQLEHWRLCEIDAFAVNSYNAIHNTQFTTSDITQTHAPDLSVVSPETYDYILTWSFPCFVAGTKVTVASGAGLGVTTKNIEDIVPGDIVITHTGEMHKVTEAKCTGTKPIYRVTAGEKEVLCTGNHLFYCKYTEHGQAGFIECKDLTDEFYCKVLDLEGITGEFFEDEDGYWQKIESVTALRMVDQVYDITVETDHTFYANGFCVHNCQSLSVSGLRKGMREGSGTTSSLIWEVRRILREMSELKEAGEKDEHGNLYGLPKILLMENVPQVIDAKNVSDLNKMRDFLESIGYSNHLAILRGSDYGVPQARHRAFMVSILGDEDNPVYSYTFPTPCGCEWNMLDVLTDDFDSKRYVRDSVAHRVCEENAAFNRNVEHKLKEIKLCGRLNSHQAGAVYDPVGVSPTLTAGGASSICVLWREPTEAADSDDFNDIMFFQPNPNEVDVTVLETAEEVSDYLFDDTQEEPDYNKESDYLWKPVVRDHVEYSIRTFTPLESLMFMDFDENDFRKASLVTSNHQMHKQAGNSIVVNCIVALLGQFFPGKENVYRQIAKVPPKDRVSFKCE